MKLEILECHSGVGKNSGKPYHIVLARVEDSGRVGKMFSDVALEVTGKVEDFDVELAPDKTLNFSPSIKGLAVKAK